MSSPARGAVRECARGDSAAGWGLDWNWDDDRGTIRSGDGPDNITALRRFAIGILKARSRDTVAATIKRLARNVRLVFDCLRMSESSRRLAQLSPVRPRS